MMSTVENPESRGFEMSQDQEVRPTICTELSTQAKAVSSPPPTPTPKTETIHELRLTCWCLDQVRIYGAIAREQNIESERIKAKTGTAPDPESFVCPFVLSEFSIEEREKDRDMTGWSDEEELEFLKEKRAVLSRLVAGEGVGTESETMPETGAVSRGKRKKKNSAVAAAKPKPKKRKRKTDDDSCSEWEPEFSPPKPQTKKLMRRAPAIAVSKGKRTAAVVSETKCVGTLGSWKHQMDATVTKRLEKKSNRR